MQIVAVASNVTMARLRKAVRSALNPRYTNHAIQGIIQPNSTGRIVAARPISNPATMLCHNALPSLNNHNAHIVSATTGKLGKRPLFAYSNTVGNERYTIALTVAVIAPSGLTRRKSAYAEKRTSTAVIKTSDPCHALFNSAAIIGIPKNPTGTSQLPCCTMLRGYRPGIDANASGSPVGTLNPCDHVHASEKTDTAVSSGEAKIAVVVRGKMVAKNKKTTLTRVPMIILRRCVVDMEERIP